MKITVKECVPGSWEVYILMNLILMILAALGKGLTDWICFGSGMIAFIYMMLFWLPSFIEKIQRKDWDIMY